MEDFRILDEEYQMVHDTYSPKATSIEELMEKYFETAMSVVDDHILEGDTAIAFQNFSSIAKLVLKSQLEEILLKHQGFTKGFMDEIANKDDAQFS